MMRRLLLATGVASLLLAGTQAALAGDCGVDCDTTLRQGRLWEAFDSVVVNGPGTPQAVRVWVPLLVDDGGPLLNNSVVTVSNGKLIAATSVFTPGGLGINAVIGMGLADVQDVNGNFTSNDIMVFETAGTSDTVGQILPDGRIVWRANFGGSQNNLEWGTYQVGQQTPIPEPEAGTGILTGPGIDGAPGGSTFLGTPAAMDDGSGGMWIGNTNFDLFTGAVPNGTNVWHYTGSPVPAATPDVVYDQASAEIYANTQGVAVDPGDGRQTQPVLANVNGRNYIVFGIADTSFPADSQGPADFMWGGVSRPRLLVVSPFEEVDPADPFANAIPVIAPDGFWFVDHKQNGGGTNVFENAHFDMNSSGQLVVLLESIQDPAVPADPNQPPTYQVALYNPQIDPVDGRILGFDPPIIIADAGGTDTINEGLAGPIFIPEDPVAGTPAYYINAISGVGINDAGNIAFTATYDTGIPVDPNDPNGPTFLDGAAYFYDAGTGTLHQVLREFDVIGAYDDDGDPNTFPVSVALGLIPQVSSDHFMAKSLADNANVLAVNFRVNNSTFLPGGSRGVAIVAVGHVGDVNFDGAVDLTDLAELLASFGTSFLSPDYNPQADFNLNGTIDLTDLAELLGRFGT